VLECANEVSTQEAEMAFSKFDLNADGAITIKEFHSIVGDPILGGPQQVHLAVTTIATEMTVMWVTTQDDNQSVVQYDTQANFNRTGRLSQSMTGTITTYNVGLDGWDGYVHTVVLTQLQTGTKYVYRVGMPNSWSDNFEFTSTPSTPRDANFQVNNFAVVGDMGTAIPLGFAVTKRIEDDNRRTPFSLVVHAGDVCYAGTGCCWELEEVWDAWGDQMQPLAARVPYMFAVGNHEHYYNYTSFSTRYSMPSKLSGGRGNFWYSFDYGNVHFTMMSTEHDYKPGSPQYNWLQNDLAKANQNRNLRPWLILTGHRPMYNSDSIEYGQHGPGSPFQVMIEPLMLKYKVDLYLNGHIHVYERIYPTINGTVVSGTGPVFTNPRAPVHVTQANSGVFLDSFDRFIVPQPVWSASRINEYGYGNMAINETHLHYAFHKIIDSEIYDQFWIVKN